MSTRFSIHWPGALALAVLASACAGETGREPPFEPDLVADAAVVGEPPVFRSCLAGTLPAGLPIVDWNRLSNELITLATPWHMAQDIIAATGSGASLSAKFSYGSVSKDLEGERIEVWLDDCAGGSRRLGERVTDSDGRIAFPLRAADVPGVGEYRVRFRVMGDDSTAVSTLRVYPPGTHFIVFDIDATLTTSDSELVGQVISEILDQGTMPEARAGAEEVVSLRHDVHGYEIIYLTGRPYLLSSLTRRWLDDLGFAPGTVRLTDSVTASWPSDSQVGQYKAEFLTGPVLGQGFVLDMAYGNATTDIYAYEQAAIAKGRTYILGEHGGASGTVALGEDYVQHNIDIAGDPPVTQPFRR